MSQTILDRAYDEQVYKAKAAQNHGYTHEKRHKDLIHRMSSLAGQPVEVWTRMMYCVESPKQWELMTETVSPVDQKFANK